MSIAANSGVSIQSINSTLGSALQTQDSRFNNMLSSLEAKGSDNLSQLDMLKVQQQVTQLSIFTELQSTIVKTISDAVKSVIQKSG